MSENRDAAKAAQKPERRTLLKYTAAGLVAGLSLCMTPLLPQNPAAQRIFSPGLAVAAENSNVLQLPEPDKSGGEPLMMCLAQRQTIRSFSNKEVSIQDLSNMLWAAWGVNRKDGKHTIPTARNKQQIAVYAVLESGVWFYEPKTNTLHLAMHGDVRSRFGSSPLSLLYAGPKDDYAAAMHVGSMYQGVGLYCASVGLGNVVKMTGKDALSRDLDLPSGYAVYIVHSIGWPK